MNPPCIQSHSTAAAVKWQESKHFPLGFYRFFDLQNISSRTKDHWSVKANVDLTASG